MYIVYKAGQKCPICGSVMRYYTSKKTGRKFVGCPSSNDEGHGSLWDSNHPAVAAYMKNTTKAEQDRIHAVDYASITLTEEQQEAVRVVEHALRTKWTAVVLEQVAGAGKTFIAGYLHQYLGLQDSATSHKDLKNPYYAGRQFALIAFNNVNASQARQRGIPAYTYHGLMLSVVRNVYKRCNRGKSHTDIQNKLRHTIGKCGVLQYTQAKEIHDRSVIGSLISITSYCMNMLSPYWDRSRILTDLESYPHKEHPIFSLLTKEDIADYVALVIKESLQEAQDYCGFDDLMYLAAYDQNIVNELLRLHLRGYKLVVWDESQDLNPARLNIAMLFSGILIPQIREVFNVRYPQDLESEDISNLPVPLILCDQNQGINGWNGAIDKIVSVVSTIFAFEGLIPRIARINTSQRTPRAIEQIVHALGFLHFRSRPDAPDGGVGVISLSSMWELAEMLHRQSRLGEMFITCRINAAAYPVVYWAVKRGLPVVFRGKNIADELHRKIRYAQMQVGDLRNNKNAVLAYLDNYFNQSMKTARNKLVRENLEHVWVILQLTGTDAVSIPDWLFRISSITSVVDEREDGSDIEERRRAQQLPNVLTVSTIHRVKGDEAKFVVTYRPDLMPHPLAQSQEEIEAEKRLIYVDATRVKCGGDHPWSDGGLKLYIDQYPGGVYV